jgi:cyclopropane fatty-acyl-phospholipid synthase-like methyltransferase
MATGPANLHAGFRDGRSAETEHLVTFLEEADRLPGVAAIRRAMREAMDVGPGTRVLDAGCGIGLEAGRLATEHPNALVVGLDRNAELLRVARRGARSSPATSSGSRATSRTCGSRRHPSTSCAPSAC